MYRNIAVKGGGIKGVAYVGSLEVLEQNGALNDLERCGGTSAGALLACMLSLNYSASEVRDLMLTLDFNKFKNGRNPLRIFTRYGLYTGNYILDYVHGIMKQSKYKFRAGATFADMRKAGCRDLYVFACNVNSQQAVEFSADATPDVSVAGAVRASMSIPFYFKAYRFKGKSHDNHLYVDGGTVYNYPLSFFDSERFNPGGEINPESLGLYLYGPDARPPKDLKYFEARYFARQLFESMLDAQDILVRADELLLKRSILIDDLNYSATDFDLTPQDMDKLIQSGRDAANSFLQSRKGMQS